MTGRQNGFDDDLTIWTIYREPLDFPDGFVTRPWLVGRGGVTRAGMAHVAATLEGAREHVPQGLYRMDRDPGDDPNIVESWL